MSLFLAVLTPLIFFLHPIMGLVVVLIWILMQLGFWSFLLKQRGAIFVLKAMAWTFIDHYVYFSGMLTGFVLSGLSLRKLHVN